MKFVNRMAPRVGPLTTDGPFAEAKEQRAGYYLSATSTVDEAVAIAAGIPGARTDRLKCSPY
jgi:hypothetical protein